jgi:site-specific recombinase XerD
MRAAGDGPDGVRLRGVIVALWRAGLQISEALPLNETDLPPDRGAYRLAGVLSSPDRPAVGGRWR